MPITAEPGAIAPRLSHVATSAKPDLPFHVLLSINKSAARAMRSAVELASLNDFLMRLGFHTEHKNVVHIGDVDPRFDLYGPDAASETLGGMGAVSFANVSLGPNVTVACYFAERWRGYALVHVADSYGRPESPLHYIHLLKVLP